MLVMASELRAPTLTPRETEIARLMAEGLSYSQIAWSLDWQPASVRKKAHQMAAKLPGNGSPVVKVLRWWFTHRTKGAA